MLHVLSIVRAIQVSRTYSNEGSALDFSSSREPGPIETWKVQSQLLYPIGRQ